MMAVSRVWREGEFVRLEHQGKTVYGVVQTATSNGCALIVEVNDLESGRAAPMPVIWDSQRGKFVGICGHPVVLHDAGPPKMSQWLIYQGGKSSPTAWVVRRWDIYPNACLPARESTECTSLEDARALVPLGLFRMPRVPTDHPSIAEVWT